MLPPCSARTERTDELIISRFREARKSIAQLEKISKVITRKRFPYFSREIKTNTWYYVPNATMYSLI